MVAQRSAAMGLRRIWAPWVLLAAAVPVWAQDAPPSTELGPPIGSFPLIDPRIDPYLDPLVRSLGGPDEQFRPFAPLGPPSNPAEEGIGTRFGLGLLGAQYG